MEKIGNKRKERLYLSSTNKSSGSDEDFRITFPTIENVYTMEWASCFNVSGQKILSIDEFNTGRHSNGVAFWRVLDTSTNQRNNSTPWDNFPDDSGRRKINTLHLKLYNTDGTPCSNTDVTTPWGIELDVFCID